MAKFTNAQLTAQVAALTAERDALLIAQRPSRAASAPRVITRVQRELPSHFIAAREAAMRLGRCVRVEA